MPPGALHWQFSEPGPSASSAEVLQWLVFCCCQQDPAARPSARELVHEVSSLAEDSGLSEHLARLAGARMCSASEAPGLVLLNLPTAPSLPSCLAVWKGPGFELKPRDFAACPAVRSGSRLGH